MFPPLIPARDRRLSAGFSQGGMLCAMAGGQLQRDQSPESAPNAASKVPEVTVYFWIIKVLTTGANVWAPMT